MTLYKNRGDSNIKGLCTLHVLQEMSIFHWKYKQNLKKGHAYVPGDRDTRTAAAVGKSAEFALATDRFLAPLICRVVRAVRVLGAGLGFPVGGTFGFTPPTSDKKLEKS